MVDKSELAIIPNAAHLTIAGQFDIATIILLNFIKGVIVLD